MNFVYNLRRLATLGLAGLAVLVTGCASGPGISGHYVSQDGSTLVVGTVRGIGGGRQMIVNDSCTLRERVTDPAVKLKIERGETPPPLCATTGSRLDLAHGTEIGRDLVTAVAPVAIGATIQGQFAKDAARSSCVGGKLCAPVVNTTVNNNLHTCGAACGN